MNNSQLYDVFWRIVRGEQVSDAELVDVFISYEAFLKLNLWLMLGMCVAVLVAFSLLTAANKTYAIFGGAQGRRQRISSRSVAWHLGFGPFWLMYKGAWAQGWLALLACVVTLGLSWLVYPFFTVALMRRHYLGLGWRELERPADSA